MCRLSALSCHPESFDDINAKTVDLMQIGEVGCKMCTASMCEQAAREDAVEIVRSPTLLCSVTLL